MAPTGMNKGAQEGALVPLKCPLKRQKFILNKRFYRCL